MSDEKTIVVTEDRAMHERGKLHDVDRAVLNPTKGIVIETVEQFKALGEAAIRTRDTFRERIGAKMTPERAARVRQLRVDEGYSWRAVAHLCFEEWDADADWQPPSNQIAGIVLCEYAAAHFGEHDREPPWN